MVLFSFSYESSAEFAVFESPSPMLHPPVSGLESMKAKKTEIPGAKTQPQQTQQKSYVYSQEMQGFNKNATSYLQLTQYHS